MNNKPLNLALIKYKEGSQHSFPYFFNRNYTSPKIPFQNGNLTKITRDTNRSQILENWYLVWKLSFEGL